MDHIYKVYTVAGHSFSLGFPPCGADLDKVLAPYVPFEGGRGHSRADFPGGEDPIFHIEFRLSDGDTAKYGRFVKRFNPEPPYVHVFESNEAHVLGFSISEDKPDLMVLVQKDLKSAVVEMDSLDSDEDVYFAVSNATMLLYALSTHDKDTLLIHASSVIYQGNCYAFIAPSGTGKSTHSRMWLENIDGTRLLNDDNPVVRLMDGRPVIFGSPWSGKTPCYRNEQYPLKAIVHIHQAPENKITPLKGIQAYASFQPSCSCMKWNRAIADGVNRSIERLLGCCSFYRLDCLPNADAATICCTEVSGQSPARKKVKCVPNAVLMEQVRELIQEGKSVTMTVKGQSMLPFIHGDRDSVLLESCHEPKVGDILLCEIAKGQFVLHRVTAITPRTPDEETEIILMGDGNLAGKEHCRRKNIVAKAVQVIRPDGRRIDCCSRASIRRARIWKGLLPIRRYLLAIYRRLPAAWKND